jgi:hypothetical protein
MTGTSISPGIEAPRRDQGLGVVPPSLNAVRETVLGASRVVAGERRCHRGGVGRREHRWIHLLFGRRARREHRFSVPSELDPCGLRVALHELELVEVIFRLSSAPIQAVGVDRRWARERSRGDHAIREPTCARERMRTAAGNTPHRDPLDPERIDDREHVVGAVRDSPSRTRGRAAVPRAVVGDQPDPLICRVHKMRAVQPTGARRPRMHKHGPTRRIPTFLD